MKILDILLNKKVKKSDPQWIKETIVNIEKLNPENALKEIKTDNDVKYSLKGDISFSLGPGPGESEFIDDEDFFSWDKIHREPSFAEILMKEIEAKGMSGVKFYKAAHMDRKLFSAMKNNSSYKPKKETAIACCFALNMDIKAAKKLLDAAGFTLSMSIAFDRVVYYCLENKIYDLSVVNEILYEMGEKTIMC